MGEFSNDIVSTFYCFTEKGAIISACRRKSERSIRRGFPSSKLHEEEAQGTKSRLLGSEFLNMSSNKGSRPLESSEPNRYSTGRPTSRTYRIRTLAHTRKVKRSLIWEYEYLFPPLA